VLDTLENTLREHPIIGAGSSFTPVVAWLDILSPVLAVLGSFLGIAIGIYTFKIKKLEYERKKAE